MTESTDAKLLVLQTLLAEERSTDERLASLRELRDGLIEEPVLLALCEAAPKEKTVEVRRAMLGLLVDTDITRFTNRAAYLEMLLSFCALEPERELRLWATRKLALLAPESPELEEVLAETLLHERSDDVIEAALVGLLRRPDKSERTHALLVEYAARCPPGSRGLLLQLFRQLTREQCETGLIAMLSPWESTPMREALLRALEELPSLSPKAGAALVAYMKNEPMRDLRARAVRILAALRDGGPGLSRALLDLLAFAPDGSELLDAFAHKLDAQPELIPIFAEMLQGRAPRRLKLKLIALLEKARAHGPLSKALADASPWVRYAAIEACARLAPQEPSLYAPLAEAAAKEEITELRANIAHAFESAQRLDEAGQKVLVEWSAKETSPRVAGSLARALPLVAITDETRTALLTTYLQVLRDPFAAPETVRAATDRLRSFAYRDEPVLIECLRELLIRADKREEAEEWDAQLKKLAPDAKARVPLTRTLLYRYLGEYPAAPTADWVRELHALAPQDEAVRAEIPLWVQLTGETWMLSAANAAEKKSALLPTVRQLLAEGKTTDAQRRIEEAWDQRTLRKSDLLALFKRVLNDLPGEVGVFQAVVQILGKAKIATPEVQELALAFLKSHARSDMAYGIGQYLNDVAKAELGYGERVAAAFTQDAYAEFCRTGDDPQDAKEVPKTFNDWEYQGFRVAYSQWQLAEIFFGLGRPDEVHAVLAAPPPDGTQATHALQSLVLHQLWRKGEETAEELISLGKLAHAATGTLLPLRDRALLIFWKRWKGYLRSLQGLAPPAELRALAAETFLHLLEVRKKFGPESKEKQPDPLLEMDLAWLESHWTAGPEAWKELQEKQLAAIAEVRAKEVLQLATQLSNKGKKPESAALLDRLLGEFAQTKLVQAKRDEIAAYRAKAG